MSAQDIISKLKEVMGDYTTIDLSKLNEDMSLKGDIGVDSFGTISMLCNIEETFDISIPDYECSNFLTVGDIVNYIQNEIA